MFWFFGPEACRILSPWLGIKPSPIASEGEVFLTTGLPEKSPLITYLLIKVVQGDQKPSGGYREEGILKWVFMLLLLLSRFSHVRLVQPHRWQPTRMPHPWDSPVKNTGVGCHFLLQCMKVKSESEVAQSCPTLSDPMDCSLPGSSIHGIFQARVFIETDFYWLIPSVTCMCILYIFLIYILYIYIISILSIDITYTFTQLWIPIGFWILP